MLNINEFKGLGRDVEEIIKRAEVLSNHNNPLIKIDEIANVKEDIRVKINECNYAVKSARTENTKEKYEGFTNELSQAYNELNEKLCLGRDYIKSLY